MTDVRELDSEIFRAVERGLEIEVGDIKRDRFSGILDLGAIYDGGVLVRGKLAFLGVRMIPFEAESGDVVIHGEAAVALSVIPLDVDASIQITLPIFGDVVVFLEGIA